MAIAEHLVVTSDWGFPSEGLDIMMLVKNYLDKLRRNVQRFRDNTPGSDYLESFLKQHSNILHMRLCQIISKKGAAMSRTTLLNYFSNLQDTILNVPPENIINYNETNFSDDPIYKKVAVKERYEVSRMDHEHIEELSCTSIMFAGTTSGELLPPYIAYKIKKMWDN